MDKEGLLEVAEMVKLKFRGKKKLTKGVIKARIVAEVARQTKEKMVLIRKETVNMGSDTNASKFVLPNIGPKDGRWRDKQELEIESQSLADILAKVGIG